LIENLKIFEDLLKNQWKVQNQIGSKWSLGGHGPPPKFIPVDSIDYPTWPATDYVIFGFTAFSF
jgi:hypothetical protein